MYLLTSSYNDATLNIIKRYILRIQKNRIMEICFITTYWKKAGGGVAVYVSSLVESLENSKDHIIVFFREGQDDKNYKIKGNKFVFAARVLSNLIKIRPEVIHSHGAWYCLLPGVVLKKFYKTKVIHTFHTSPKDEKIPLIGKIFLQYLIYNCDVVTFVSRNLKKEYEKFWGLKFRKYEITYPGVKKINVTREELENFKEKFQLQERRPILLMQGFTAHRLKAQSAKLAILALKKLRHTYPRIVLVMTRNGRYLDELKTFAKYEGVLDAVTFTGDLENPFVALEACDIYMHISLGEGLGIELIEAMSVGKPVVATNVGGIPEVIYNFQNGLLISPEVQEIVEAVNYILKNTNIVHKLTDNGKKIVEKKFNWSLTKDQILKLYS
ncbi:MAG: hypothetical protein Metus_1432 [Candidatus Methanosuratincola subterraneus]|uniref:Glycosyltransferase family 1 protein n=1 Tax=Methanosuratincola subterraneus TaxID=2593994 RepID=A0A444L7C4_METS7|nr:MAG: hypothetical protein Metus_1432 [Candidatus Methanosuratincola subterraneus]